MNFKLIFALLCLFPGTLLGVTRDEGDARVGMNRVSMGPRMPAVTKKFKSNNTAAVATPTATPVETTGAVDATDVASVSEKAEVAPVAAQASVTETAATPVAASVDSSANVGSIGAAIASAAPATVTTTTVATEPAPVVGSSDCREAYRECMDSFCLLDESEGARCACSDNIYISKDLIQEIQAIQAEADNLYTEGVEREQLGARAKLVFGESDAAKKASEASGLSILDWFNSSDDEEDEEYDGELAEDIDIGDALYEMAAGFCADTLASCGSKAAMEEKLYTRQIVSDCKSFDMYLADQKINANANKRTAESAVRKARLEMLNTTNKYNRGECLLAYRGCIADKGGCGTNFENCLDADLLGRRANACENVLDQCMAVKDYVLKDWADESEMILANAEKYADKYARQTCLARIQNCLEEGCSTSTNSACLTDVNVAAGVCPVIDECEEMIPGIKTVVNDKLGYLRLQFCQNDIDKCLRDKCGENFNAPECVGKKPVEIAEMCPQDMYPSCKGETQFDIIVQAVLLQMDYQLMQGCLNYFGEQLGRVCGTDMSCLPMDSTVASLTEIPVDSAAMLALRSTVADNSQAAVDEFFKQFEQDITVAACQDTAQPEGSSRSNLGTSIFNSAKMLAQVNAEQRALRELESKIAELSRQQDLEEAEQNCYNTYKVDAPKNSEEDEENANKAITYIRSVSFEPDLRNCHVCRVQRVCESGGESKGAAAMKGVAGGLTAGASMGTMVSPGWGTAIGGLVGGVGMGLAAGLTSEGIKDFCQEIESCEDINM